MLCYLFTLFFTFWFNNLWSCIGPASKEIGIVVEKCSSQNHNMILLFILYNNLYRIESTYLLVVVVALSCFGKQTSLATPKRITSPDHHYLGRRYYFNIKL